MSGALKSLLALKKQAQIFGAPSVRSFAAETLPQFSKSLVRDPATGLLAPQWHYGSFGVDPGNSKPRPGMHFGTRKAAQERDIGAPFEYLDRNLTQEVVDEFGWDWKDPRTGEEVKRRMDHIMDSDPAAALEGYRPDPGSVKTSPYLLDIRKPLIVEDAGGDNDKWNYLLRLAREQDRDGLLYKNKVEDKGSNSWVTLGDRPQVKSLRARTLDMGDADVYKAGGGLVRGLKAVRKGLAAADPEALTPAARLKDADEQLRRLPEVIKKPGGNWLTGSVERAVEPLKTEDLQAPLRRDILNRQLNQVASMRQRGEDIPAGTEEFAMRELATVDREEALNRWIDKKLTPYIKNDMATERDPIRALAERGVTHAEMPDREFVNVDRHRSEWSGADGYGESPEAVRWEDASDMAIRPRLLGDLRQDLGALVDAPTMPDGSANPVAPLARLPDETEVYGLSDLRTAGYLGLDHIVDVLREQLTTGALTPQQLDKINIANAVERTHAYNLEREAARKAALAANLESMTPYKAYDEGWRWVQLDKPGQFAAESDAMGHSVRGYEPPRGHKDWTKESGNSGSPHYGLGGWDAITSGRAKIYSLKDKDGKTYATAEVGPSNLNDKIAELLDEIVQPNSNLEKRMIQSFGNGEEVVDGRGLIERLNWAADHINDEDLYERFLDLKKRIDSPPIVVRQLKGPSNGRPDPAALPYIQDFVRSGNWSEVRDLQNAGLQRIRNKYFTQKELNNIFLNAVSELDLRDREGHSPRDKFTAWDYFGNEHRFAGQELSPFDAAVLRHLGFEP